MTQLLYLKDPYVKEFNATVMDVVVDESGDVWVELDQTHFYPTGGGQPHDTGTLSCDGTEYLVEDVSKKIGKVLHRVNFAGLKKGDHIHGVIDWDQRYKLMRMHTASHIIGTLICNRMNAKITGGNLDLEKSRCDFNFPDYSKDAIVSCFEEANKVIAQHIEREFSFMSREEALAQEHLVKLANVLPPDVKELRVVKLGDADEQVCGGCHLKNTSEIGTLKLLKIDNRGKSNRRVYFTIE